MHGVLRAPAEGEGGVAYRENLSASTTLERSAGTVAHGKRAAREVSADFCVPSFQAKRAH